MKLSNALLLASSAAAVAVALPTLEARKDNFIHIDDSERGDKLITYNGDWTHAYEQDQIGVIVYKNTESYSNDPTASYSIPNREGNLQGWSYLSIYAGKKSDRGAFDIYADDVKIATGDAYDPNCGEKCTSDVVAKVDLYKLGVKFGQIITVKNVEIDERLGKTPYLDLDQLVFTPGYPH